MIPTQHAHARMLIPIPLSYTCGIDGDLAGAETLRTLLAALKDVLGKPPTVSLLFAQFARLCLVVDEVIYEVSGGGLLHTLAHARMHKGRLPDTHTHTHTLPHARG